MKQYRVISTAAGYDLGTVVEPINEMEQRDLDRGSIGWIKRVGEEGPLTRSAYLTELEEIASASDKALEFLKAKLDELKPNECSSANGWRTAQLEFVEEMFREVYGLAPVYRTEFDLVPVE